MLSSIGTMDDKADPYGHQGHCGIPRLWETLHSKETTFWKKTTLEANGQRSWSSIYIDVTKQHPFFFADKLTCLACWVSVAYARMYNTTPDAAENDDDLWYFKEKIHAYVKNVLLP